jgi:GNAT superfamily N-acetyltransferase
MSSDTRTAPTRGLAVTVADLRGHYREHGLGTLLGKLGRRLRSTLYSEEKMVVLEKDLRSVTELATEEALRVEPLEDRHLPAVYEFNRRRNFSKADRRAAASVERGYRGFVGFLDDQLVGYYWWVDGEIEPRHADIQRYGLGIELGPGDVYGYDFFLLEEHRGDGNSTEFLHKVETGLRDLGYTRLCGYVVAGNRPARWLYSLRGYQAVRTVTTRRVLRRPISRRVEEEAA